MDAVHEPARSAATALADLEAQQKPFGAPRLKAAFIVALVAAFYLLAGYLVHFDLGRLASGLPKLGRWIVGAWPPDFAELPLFLRRTGETVAMAAIGTTLAVLIALPLAVLASRNITPFPRLYYPTRWLLNALRGIDSFVFALLFVAAVGLGPFAGVLGIAFHTSGTVAKFFADQIESTNLGPYEAIRAAGASGPAAVSFALVPDILPLMLSTSLFWWEFNVRASTVLGVVGAGGIGQELKNSMDLLDFSRLFTIIAVILVAVTAIDWFSGWLRKRLV
ncbi:MAG: phosphonate ABC transporter, permease protein PhnE [Rhodomicrobium sp.]